MKRPTASPTKYKSTPQCCHQENPQQATRNRVRQRRKPTRVCHNRERNLTSSIARPQCTTRGKGTTKHHEKCQNPNSGRPRHPIAGQNNHQTTTETANAHNLRYQSKTELLTVNYGEANIPCSKNTTLWHKCA
jgi:hypothetical protein